MKKILNIAIVAIMALAVGLASCGSKSNADLIKDYQKKCEEAIEAMQNNDMEKFQKLTEESREIVRQIEANGMSDSEKMEMAQINNSMAEKLMTVGASLFNNAIESAGNMVQDAGDALDPSAIKEAESQVKEAVDKVQDALDEDNDEDED